ncbi:hypothetical protein HDU76_009165 [Blyttiomyces sp. JEL0837]|nr:hypothetical protein HDU76_009165 [Blyttiomyces sp. JEL0837]
MSSSPTPSDSKKPTSLWDTKLPPEIKERIFKFTDPVTRHLNDVYDSMLDDSDLYTRQQKIEVWNIAIDIANKISLSKDMDSDTKLETIQKLFWAIPRYSRPSIGDGLCTIKSREFYNEIYENRGRFDHDGNGFDSITYFFNADIYWRWWKSYDQVNLSNMNFIQLISLQAEKDMEFHYYQSFIERIKDLERDFIQVPMRNRWMDVLEEHQWTKLDQVKLFIVTGCFGHLNLFIILLAKETVSINGNGVFGGITFKNPPPQTISFSEICTIIFIVACERGHLAVIKFLLNLHKTDQITIDFDKFNHHAIREASSNGYLEIVKILLELNLDPSLQQSKALRSACINGHMDIVKLLLSTNKVDINDVTMNDNQVFWKACGNGHIDVVKFLLGYPNLNVDPGAKDNAAIRLAAEGGYLELVKFLCGVPGVDPSACDNDAVFRASCEDSSFPDVVEFLLTVPGVGMYGDDHYYREIS